MMLTGISGWRAPVAKSARAWNRLMRRRYKLRVAMRHMRRALMLVNVVDAVAYVACHMLAG